ncbi:hypothetical protein M1L60_02375 [Actinoplanes sp. TRM 88003]|uniref:Uncharacterized protein n=1 Tax=Paractinoplanes aksuensis TaxID=2939490 RepID=A0ABT1DF35_9ACTN|nr:hypothetical protein [Actinoplanes aksuensis]MCO8269433.1 hypothetical protein [Actinoplanes aksuensis]
MAKSKIDVLVVRWYERRAAPDIVDRWFEAADAHLPEATPVRFGESEPLRGRGGRAEVEAAWTRAGSLLFLAGRPPVHHASLGAGGGTRLGPAVAHSLQIAVDPGDARVRQFALAVAGADTLYVSASVAGGMTLDRKTLWGPAERPEEPYLAPLGQWLGLPPEPPVWCWFGSVYAKEVGTDFYEGGPWVPPRLRAQLDEVDPARRRAAWLPGESRPSWWRLLLERRTRP